MNRVNSLVTNVIPTFILSERKRMKRVLMHVDEEDEEETIFEESHEKLVQGIEDLKEEEEEEDEEKCSGRTPKDEQRIGFIGTHIPLTLSTTLRRRCSSLPIVAYLGI